MECGVHRTFSLSVTRRKWWKSQVQLLMKIERKRHGRHAMSPALLQQHIYPPDEYLILSDFRWNVQVSFHVQWRFSTTRTNWWNRFLDQIITENALRHPHGNCYNDVLSCKYNQRWEDSGEISDGGFVTWSLSLRCFFLMDDIRFAIIIGKMPPDISTECREFSRNLWKGKSRALTTRPGTLFAPDQLF